MTQFQAQQSCRYLVSVLQQDKKTQVPNPWRVRKIHTSNSKETYKKGQPEPKGKRVEESTTSQVNSLVSTTMADKMDESGSTEWRRIHIKD